MSGNADEHRKEADHHQASADNLHHCTAGSGRLPNNAPVCRINTGMAPKTSFIDVSTDMRNPSQCGHRFRGKAATQSDRKRPPIPNEGGHPVDRVRRGALSAV
jgi:hypothetical protein